MKKIILLALSSFIMNASAQNNAIFFGGSGKGNTAGNYQQISSDQMFFGGVGQGATTQSFVQASLNLMLGGTGDGVASNFYEPSTFNLMLGGSGSGNSFQNYVQAGDELLFLGGTSAGNTSQSYIQSGDDLLFLGGTAQGIASSNYIQEANVSRFLGGNGDGWVGYEATLPLNPLSVESVLFTGKVIDATHVLDWTVTQEKEVSHYVLEHSYKNDKFLELGMVTANNLISGNYSFTNKKPAIGNNYYRLKIVNQDKSISYSSTILLKKFEDGTIVNAYPNPVSNTLNIAIESATDKTNNILVLNVNGSIVFQKELKAGEHLTSIDVSSWAAGNYFLVLKNNSMSSTIKIQKL